MSNFLTQVRLKTLTWKSRIMRMTPAASAVGRRNYFRQSRGVLDKESTEGVDHHQPAARQRGPMEGLTMRTRIIDAAALLLLAAIVLIMLVLVGHMRAEPMPLPNVRNCAHFD